MIGTIIGALILGIIIGPLARLVVPGKQNLSVLATIGLGALGALLGGVISNALGLGVILSLVVAVLVAAALVAIVAGTSSKSGARA